MTKRKIVLIRWPDARIFTGQFNEKDAMEKEPEYFSSLGFLIDSGTVITKIAHEITDSGEYRDILLIPTGSILSIKELKE